MSYWPGNMQDSKINTLMAKTSRHDISIIIRNYICLYFDGYVHSHTGFLNHEQIILTKYTNQGIHWIILLFIYSVCQYNRIFPCLVSPSLFLVEQLNKYSLQRFNRDRTRLWSGHFILMGKGTGWWTEHFMRIKLFFPAFLCIWCTRGV